MQSVFWSYNHKWGCGVFTISTHLAFLCWPSPLLLAIFLWGGRPCGEVHCWRQGIIHIGVQVECAHPKTVGICIFGRNSLLSDIFKCQRQCHLSHPTIFVGHSMKKNPLWQYVPWRCLRVPFKSVCVELLLGACLCQINSFTLLALQGFHFCLWAIHWAVSFHGIYFLFLIFWLKISW